MRDLIESVVKAPVTRLGLRCLLIMVPVVLLDQATKAWILYGLRLQLQESVTILPIFSFTLVHNESMSFGLLPHGPFVRWLLTFFQLGAAAVLGYCATKVKQPLLGLSLGLIAGGALGNAIDRIRFGFVIDFVDVSGTHIFPWVFNVADSAICIGVALLAWYFLRSDVPAKDKTPA